MTAWNLSELRSSLLSGIFEKISREECINAYAVNYLSDRRTIVAVASDPMAINSSLALAGYGFPSRMPEAIPHNQVGTIMRDLYMTASNGFEWMCIGSCSNISFQEWELFAVYYHKITQVDVANGTLQMTPFTAPNDQAQLQSETNLTTKMRDSFLSFLQDNPAVRQTESYLENVDWSSHVSNWNVSSYCEGLMYA